MKRSRNWAIIDAVVAGAGAILSLVGLFTNVKASQYNDAQEDLRLEEKYGLTAINKEDE